MENRKANNKMPEEYKEQMEKIRALRRIVDRQQDADEKARRKKREAIERDNQGNMKEIEEDFKPDEKRLAKINAIREQRREENEKKRMAKQEALEQAAKNQEIENSLAAPVEAATPIKAAAPVLNVKEEKEEQKPADPEKETQKSNPNKFQFAKPATVYTTSDSFKGVKCRIS